MENREFIGVDLKAIYRIKVRPGELGYGRRGFAPMDHYYLNMNYPLSIFEPTKPQAIVNIGLKLFTITCFVQLRWFDNIRTVENAPPGYEKIILIWREDPIKEDKTYVS